MSKFSFLSRHRQRLTVISVAGPAVVVAVSAAVYHQGYGTLHQCVLYRTISLSHFIALLISSQTCHKIIGFL